MKEIIIKMQKRYVWSKKTYEFLFTNLYENYKLPKLEPVVEFYFRCLKNAEIIDYYEVAIINNSELKKRFLKWSTAFKKLAFDINNYLLKVINIYDQDHFLLNVKKGGFLKNRL